MNSMAASKLFLPVIFILLVLFNPGETVKLSNGNYFCVSKPSSAESALDANIDFACKNLFGYKYDCSLIQPGGSCFYPNITINHASVVMNLYYQFHGRNSWNCDFKNSGLIVITDPSYGACKYPDGP